MPEVVSEAGLVMYKNGGIFLGTQIFIILFQPFHPLFYDIQISNTVINLIYAP